MPQTQPQENEAPRCVVGNRVVTPDPKPATVCPAPGIAVKPLANPVDLTFTDAPAVPSIRAEFAFAEDDLERGLMFRTSLGEKAGMLFDLRERKVQRFWMRNTCIPLDMLFVDDDGLVVGVLENVPVLNDGERFVDCPSRYVLEVNAGFCARYGVRSGMHVRLPKRNP